jgi:tetratricopeptide (TPR) repeat protein
MGAEAGTLRQMSIGPKAIKAWEEAARLDPRNINARASLVGVYPMAPGFMGGGADKAEKTAKELSPLLEESLSKNPDHHFHLYWYGKASALTGLNLDRGEQCLKRYVTFTPAEGEPGVGGAHMRLGEIKEKQGKKLEAKKCFQAALAKDPNLKGAKAGLERTSE